MSLMLSTFPPSSELENYLEMFLRGKREDECINKLHLIVYGEPVPGIPRMHQIEGLRGKGRRFSLWGRADTAATDANKKASRRPAAAAAAAGVEKVPGSSSRSGGSTTLKAKPRRRGSVEAMPVPKSAPPPLPTQNPRAGAVVASEHSTEVAAAVTTNEPAEVEPAVAAAAQTSASAEVTASAEDAPAAAVATEVAVAEGAPTEEPLPEGWQEFEAEGKLFYYHAESGRTQWDRPPQ